MNFVNNLKIGVRLGTAFALLIVAMLVITLMGRLGMGHIEERLVEATEDRVPKVLMVNGVIDNVNVIARAIRNMALMDEISQREGEAKRIRDAAAGNATLLDKLDGLVENPKGRQLLADVKRLRGQFNEQLDKVVKVAMAGDAQATREVLLGDMRKVQLDYLKSLDDFENFQVELMDVSNKEAKVEVQRAEQLLWAIAITATLIGAFMAVLITRSVTLPMAEAVKIAETVADGDLRSDIQVTRKDEAGDLLAALKKMNEKLVDIVGTVRGNADSVATASGQIAQGNADLSQRTEEQASNLQQTAASMEQLTATVNHNNDTALQAAQLATSASAVAVEGGVVVGRVVSTMEEITASSRKISDIIGVIDGIAFQTNILALNAAVEAARAGEQGRGFAVVAGEVRTLASRSAEAAREIKGLIHASVERVEAGSQLVNQAGHTMQNVVNQVRRVSDLISEISSATSEQSKGIGQIGDAVSQLDQVTQQNAALVEESAAAADSLQHQSAELARTVAVFRLSHDREPVAASMPASRPAVKVAARKPAPSVKAAPRPAPAKRATAEATPDAKSEWASF